MPYVPTQPLPAFISEDFNRTGVDLPPDHSPGSGRSRDSGLDLAVAFNFWVPDTAKGQLLARIGPVLDAAGL